MALGETEEDLVARARMRPTTARSRPGNGDNATFPKRRPKRIPTPIPRKLAIRRKFEKNPM